ncbi:MAG: hypothetical protein Q8933_01880 [Bacteroidota bacterium]|nr:hypothetical protein [Bacteroidota bacterium]MDP4194754.1 hypothetical protein [Bacteroidota bacterium]
MKWYLINTGFNTGKYNMDYDIQLAGKASDNQAFLRFYRWNPYCISLGANQKFEDIDSMKAELCGLDIVKRPTGGRAILHAEELTYSVVIPTSAQISSTEIYRRVSLALVSGLRHYNNLLNKVELETLQPNFADLLKNPSGMVCFGSTAKSEVKFNGLKLIGSAQRKMGHVILQHGSILCGDFHIKLAEFLNLPDEQSNIIKNEMISKTIDLKSILNVEIDYDMLTEYITMGFESEFGIEFENVVPDNIIYNNVT